MAVTRNIFANYAGSIWSALVSLLAVPIYLHVLGIEAYGLIGIFATMQALFAPLDAGLSSSSARELAILSAREDDAGKSQNVVRTVATIYWAVALMIGIGIAFLSPLVATRWLNHSTIPLTMLTRSIMLMGLVATLQWPLSFYLGALYGMQRQVLANVVTTLCATLSAGGAILTLKFISPTPVAFFAWQAIATGVQTLTVMICVWQTVPKRPEAPRFDPEILRTIWRFAGGLIIITLLAVGLTQVDKVILSKLAPMRVFGYYTLAGTVAASLYRLVVPISQALAPRFAQLVASKYESTLLHTYHTGCQMMSVIIFPVSIVLIVFAPEVLLLWTRDPVTAANAASSMRLLLVGTTLNAMMYLPYQLQLAYGWVRFAIATNVVAVCVFIPLTIILTLRYGGVGAAASWSLLNLGYVLIAIPVMHRFLLPSAKWRWYLLDVGAPLTAAIAAGFLARAVFPQGGSRIVTLLLIGCAWLATSTLSAAVSPIIRGRLSSLLRSLEARIA